MKGGRERKGEDASFHDASWPAVDSGWCRDDNH